MVTDESIAQANAPCILEFMGEDCNMTEDPILREPRIPRTIRSSGAKDIRDISEAGLSR